MALLEKSRDGRGIAHWNKLDLGKLVSFGIGLTKLRKLAKQVGRDHALALRLWKSKVFDAKVLGALIDEPARMTRAQAEAQVKDVAFWMLAYVYCSGPLAKTAFARELAVDWMASKDAVRRRCGYLLLGQLVEDVKAKDGTWTDDFLEGCIERIAKSIRREENFVKDAMNNALFALGRRNVRLNKKSLAAARSIGKVEVDYGPNSCEALDVVKHLTSERVQKSLRRS
jgi:3-methyladenine DNA glycosylase AlkD